MYVRKLEKLVIVLVATVMLLAVIIMALGVQAKELQLELARYKETSVATDTTEETEQETTTETEAVTEQETEATTEAETTAETTPTTASTTAGMKSTTASTSSGITSTTAGKKMILTATAYCPCVKCCGKTNGITATGTKATAGRTIAVDPKVIPYGSKVIINGNTYIAEDCGGAIKSNKIDIFFNTHYEALQWGIRTVEAEVIV